MSRAQPTRGSRVSRNPPAVAGPFPKWQLNHKGASCRGVAVLESAGMWGFSRAYWTRNVLFGKYGAHLPLYRPERDLRARGRGAGRVNAGRLGRRLRGNTNADQRSDREARARRRTHPRRRQCAAEAHGKEGLHDLMFCVRKLR